MKFKQPSIGTKADTFLPFLISCTRTHLRIAELGCLASIPLKIKLIKVKIIRTSFPIQFPWHGKLHQMGLPSEQYLNFSSYIAYQPNNFSFCVFLIFDLREYL